MLDAIWVALPFVGEFLLKLVLVGGILVRRRARPATTLAWIVVILALPIIGLVAFVLVGGVRLGHWRRKRHRAIAELIEAPARDWRRRGDAAWCAIPPAFMPIARLAEAVSLNVPRPGNDLLLVGDTDELIARLVADIDEATSYCHLLFYIYLPDHAGTCVAAALRRAARRGVATRLLVDAVGSRTFLRSDLCREMRRDGVRVVDALPASLLRMAFERVDLRNHRKIVVIDGRIAYTGSQNIADAAFAPKARYAPWVDVMVRLEGPVTHDLHVLFVEDWYLDTDESLADLLSTLPPPVEGGVVAQVIGSGPNADTETLRELMSAALHAARDELVITTPYFVPDEATAIALRTSARRGVDTTLVVPARNDSPLVAAASRSHYDGLLGSGVRLHEYHGGLLHAKTMTVDRDLALVTTANFDRRSFELNFEVSLLVFDSDFASQLRFLQHGYLASSDRVAPAAWRRRPWRDRLWSNAVGILSPLL